MVGIKTYIYFPRIKTGSAPLAVTFLWTNSRMIKLYEMKCEVWDFVTRLTSWGLFCQEHIISVVFRYLTPLRLVWRKSTRAVQIRKRLFKNNFFTKILKQSYEILFSTHFQLRSKHYCRRTGSFLIPVS